MTCSNCRYHSKRTRPKVLGVGDADLEMIEEDETETQDDYTCQHPKQAGRFQGTDETAGAGCALWEAGQKKLDDHTARLIAAAEARLAAQTDREE